MKKVQKKPRKTHPQIIYSAIAALICVFLAFKFHPAWIIPAVVLWWMNKRYIKRHLG